MFTTRADELLLYHGMIVCGTNGSGIFAELQSNLDRKVKELVSKSNSVSSLGELLLCIMFHKYVSTCSF